MTDRKPLRSQPTRDRILAAARRAFAADGFEHTTVRGIAAAAGCNPALVIRYYGSKEALFAAALAFDLELPPVDEGPREALGERLAAHFLDRWERQLADNELVALLRAGVNHEGARQRMVAIFDTQLTETIRRACGDHTAPARAALIASHLLGLGLTRYILKFPAAVDLTKETIVRSVGRTIQAYLTGPLPSSRAKRTVRASS